MEENEQDPIASMSEQDVDARLAELTQKAAAAKPDLSKIDSMSEAEVDAALGYYEAKQQRVLAPARQYAAEKFPTTSGLVRAVAFPRDIITGYIYGRSKKALDEGRADESDLRNIAIYEQEHQRRAESEQSLGGFLGARAMELPSQAAGFMVGGRIAQAATPAGLATAPGLAAATGRAAIQAAATPNLGPQMVVQKNIAAGRDPLDLRGVPEGLGLATAQMMVLQATGGLTGKIAPGAGQAAQIGIQAASGPFAQAATDVVTSAVGLDTGYGNVGRMFRGEYGEAMKHAAGDILMFGAFAAMHGQADHGKEVVKEAADAIQSARKAGLSPEAAARKGQKVIEAAKADLQTAEPAPEAEPAPPVHAAEEIPGEFGQAGAEALRERPLPAPESSVARPEGQAAQTSPEPVERAPGANGELAIRERGQAGVRPYQSHEQTEANRSRAETLREAGYSDRQIAGMSEESLKDHVFVAAAAKREFERRLMTSESDPIAWAERMQELTEVSGHAGRVQRPENAPKWTAEPRRRRTDDNYLAQKARELFDWAESQGLSKTEAIESLRDEIEEGRVRDERDERFYAPDLLDFLRRQTNVVERPALPTAPEVPPERVETMRQALQSLGVNSKKWSPEKVMAEAQKLGIDKATERAVASKQQVSTPENVEKTSAAEVAKASNEQVNQPQGPLTAVERRRPGRPPQDVWEGIKAEHPDWSVEQIGREAARQVKELRTDKLTGFGNGQVGTAREDATRSAIAHVEQTGEASTYAEIDLRNLGGLNAVAGHQGANEHYRAFADILRSELEPLGDVTLFRHGGDEMSAIAQGIPQAEVNAALERAQQRIAAYVSEKGLSEIPHPKRKGEKGTGIHFGTAEMGAGEKPEDVYKRADRLLESRKVAGDVQRAQVEAVGAGPSGEPARGATEGTGPAEASPQQRGGRPAGEVDTGPASQGAEGPPEAPPAAQGTEGLTREQIRRADRAKMREMAAEKAAKEAAAEKAKGTPAERLQRARVEKAYPEVFEAAKEAGIDLAELHQTAKYYFERNRGADQGAIEKNQLIDDAYAALKEFGITRQKVIGVRRAGRDAAAVRGLDEVAEDLSKRYKPFFSENEHTSDTLLEILQEGKVELTAERDAYDQAVGDMLNERERSAATEARQAGFSSRAIEEVSRHFESEGEAEGSAAEAESDAADVGDFDFGANAPEPAKLKPADVFDRLQEGKPIEGITAKQADDLRQHVIEEKTLEEIGRKRGVTREAVRKSVDKALDKLQDVVADVPRPPTEDDSPAILKPGLGELPSRWVESPEVEKVSDALIDYVSEAARGNRELPTEELVRINKLRTALDDARPGSAAERESIAKAAAFLEEAGYDLRRLGRLGTSKRLADRIAAERLGVEPVVADKLMSLAVDFLKEEGGFVNPSQLYRGALNRAAQLADGYKRATTYLGDHFGELSGQMFPRITRLGKNAGEAVARFVSAPAYARLKAPRLIDKVLGPNATEADRTLYGAAMTEEQLRYTRRAYEKKARDESNEALRLKAMGDLDGAKEHFELADAAGKAARKVTTTIGQAWSPLADFQAYKDVVTSPRYQEIVKAWEAHMVPEMEANYRASQGLDPTDPIDSFTQIPGRPMNLLAAEDPGSASPGAKPNFKALKQGKNPFSNVRTGAAEKYNLDLAAIVENSINRGATNAAKAQAIRTMVEEGVAHWGKPGERVEGAKEFPFTNPPKGTQENQRGETSLYVANEAAGEWAKALNLDKRFEIPVLTGALNTVTKAALASTAEATYHSRNLLTFLTKPGVTPQDFLKNAYGVITKNKGVADRIVDLARIGAMKEHGFESPTAFMNSKLNPLTWMGKFLGVLDSTMRLTASDAFDRLRASGRVEGSETNKRNFINQLGQYNRRAQNDLVVLLRDTGLGPFATAGTNFYAQGLRALTMNPGVTATSKAQAVGLRAEMLARTVGVLSTVALANYLRWGRVDGDDKTPLGSIKVGTSNGKTQYIDLTATLSSLTRGAREVGALAMAQGKREGKDQAKTEDKAVDAIWHSLLHPAVGPGVQFAYTAGTGKNTMGFQVAEKPPEGVTHAWMNLKAALLNANPAIATATGAENPKEKLTPGEKAWKLLGPFGVQRR